MGDAEGARRMERPVRWVRGEGHLETESCEIQQGGAGGRAAFIPFVRYSYTEGLTVLLAIISS